MLEAIREFLRLDTATFTMTLVWLPVMIAVGLANIFLVPRESPRSGTVPERPNRFAEFGKSVLAFVAATGITPNHVTLTGLALVLGNCVAYVIHRDAVLFGIGLIIAYVFDTLDGLVARAQKSTTLFGGYLDAVVDRMQETATLLVVGIVTGYWLPVFLVVSGSMMTSYNKARAAIEIPVKNKGWPDFFDKTVRQFFLCFAMIASDSIPWSLLAGLWILAAAAYFTAFQRIIRASFLIGAHEKSRETPSDT